MAIEINKIYCKFPNEESALIDIKHKISFPYGISLLVSPSGAGKTTLFRLLSGWYCGNSQIQSEVVLNIDLLRDVSLVGNHSSFLPWKRIIENILVRSVALSENEIIKLGEYIGLKKTAFYQWPYELSLGMYKRMEFLAAIASDNSLLLLDEFFASIDAEIRKSCLDLLVDYRKNEKTTIISTHNPEIFDFSTINFGYSPQGSINQLAIL
jgi:ABC-type nitrate/sulfonate/bicarbonate transport system ATPase subunit